MAAIVTVLIILMAKPAAEADGIARSQCPDLAAFSGLGSDGKWRGNMRRDLEIALGKPKLPHAKVTLPLKSPGSYLPKGQEQIILWPHLMLNKLSQVL